MTVAFVIYYGVLMFAGGVAAGGAIWTIRYHKKLDYRDRRRIKGESPSRGSKQ